MQRSWTDMYNLSSVSLAGSPLFRIDCGYGAISHTFVILDQDTLCTTVIAGPAGFSTSIHQRARCVADANRVEIAGATSAADGLGSIMRYYGWRGR